MVIRSIKEKFSNIIKNDLLMKATVAVVIINILYIIIGSILFSVNKSFFTYKMFSIGLMILGGINIVNIIVLCIKKKYRKNLIHLFILFVLIFTIIAAIFAREKRKALWGCRR